VAEGTPLREAVEAEVARAATAPSEPSIYAPLPPETLRRLPAGRGLELSPYGLRSRADDPVQIFDSLISAAAFFYPLRARLRLLDRARAQIVQAASRQRRRLQRAERNLRTGLAQAQDYERLQQLGDLLLANPTLTMGPASVTVADLYREGEEVTIDIDATIDLAANAERYYRHAQRARRKLAQDTARLERVAIDLAGLDAIQDRAAAMEDVGTLHRVLDEARALGMELDPHALREPEAEGAPTLDRLKPDGGPALPGILRVRTADGAEVLVGRSATANDRLTHEVAGRRDWWLHALGPGSHVVLRNPERLEQPRPEQLVAAARLAAWFSRSRGASKVEVHWTTTGRVRRPRGGKPGQVLIEGHHSLVVEPAPPAEIGRDTNDGR
jgi:predicted ribosome quality control (RQC) complex YloA/Tae2 family protein